MALKFLFFPNESSNFWKFRLHSVNGVSEWLHYRTFEERKLRRVFEIIWRKNEKTTEKCSTKENSKICEKFSNFLKDRKTEKGNDDNEDTKKINKDLRESPLHSSTQSSEQATQTSTQSIEKTTQTKTLPQLFKSKECTIGKLIETSRTGFQIDVILVLNI